PARKHARKEIGGAGRVARRRRGAREHVGADRDAAVDRRLADLAADADRRLPEPAATPRSRGGRRLRARRRLLRGAAVESARTPRAAARRRTFGAVERRETDRLGASKNPDISRKMSLYWLRSFPLLRTSYEGWPPGAPHAIRRFIPSRSLLLPARSRSRARRRRPTCRRRRYVAHHDQRARRLRRQRTELFVYAGPGHVLRAAQLRTRGRGRVQWFVRLLVSRLLGRQRRAPPDRALSRRH